MKNTHPSKWYSLAKQLGTDGQQKDDLNVECLKNLSMQESVEQIAQHFRKISQEYQPLDLKALPAYLPVQNVLEVKRSDIAEKIHHQKSRKSTLPIDIPAKLRKLIPWELSEPVTDIINACLKSQYYPCQWKHEYVVPVEKVNNPTELNDLRKISLTSEYSLIFESVMKEWILTDISPKLDKAQFGNQLGTGTEHLLVKFVDKLYKLLDENKNSL